MTGAGVAFSAGLDLALFGEQIAGAGGAPRMLWHASGGSAGG
ncbi:MAG: hypothetical protein ACR2KP_11560 [Egibacteraceae bacterium]